MYIVVSRRDEIVAVRKRAILPFRVVVCYRITFNWLDKDGKGAAHTSRITHAWLRTGNDWQIIGGMSMPEA